MVYPFLGSRVESVPVTIGEIDRINSKHASSYDHVTLSTQVNGSDITDIWSVPAVFGPFHQGETVDGFFSKDGETNQLAIARIIRWPISIPQISIATLLLSLLFVLVISTIHDRRVDAGQGQR